MESDSGDENPQDIIMDSGDDKYEKFGRISLAVLYITVFLLAFWTAGQLEASLSLPILIFVPPVLAYGIYVSWMAYKEQQKQKIQTLLPSHGQSLIYGGTSVRAEIDTPPEVNPGRNNDERQRRMSLLRAEEVTMKKELKYLEQKAAEAYQKHDEACNFLNRVKSQKFADNEAA